jgi:hypothetical protein
MACSKFKRKESIKSNCSENYIEKQDKTRGDKIEKLEKRVGFAKKICINDEIARELFSS